MFATFQAIALSTSRGMRRTERVEGKRQPEHRVVDGKIVLRFFLTK